MKKSLLLGISLILAFSYAFGQKKYPGITFGYNMATFTGDSTLFNYKSPRWGIYAGLLWDFYINQDTYIQFGISYSQQGAQFYNEYYYQGLFHKDLVVHKIDYLQFPLVWKERWTQIYTLIGGYVGIVPITPESQWYEYTYYPDSIAVNTGTYYSFANNIKSFDLGPIFGLGYQFQLSPQFDFFFEVKYRPGIVRLNKEYTRPIYNIKNQIFTFNIGIISIGKASRHNRYIHKRKR